MSLASSAFSVGRSSMVYISSDDVEPAIIELVSLCLLYVGVRMYPLQHSLGEKIGPRKVLGVLACV